MSQSIFTSHPLAYTPTQVPVEAGPPIQHPPPTTNAPVQQMIVEHSSQTTPQIISQPPPPALYNQPTVPPGQVRKSTHFISYNIKINSYLII